MSLEMESHHPMNKKMNSTLSISSTYAGDSSSDSMMSYDENTYTDAKMYSTQMEYSTPYVASTWSNQNCSPAWSSNNTAGFQNFGYDQDRGFDRSAMPSTRENSPEPMWNHTANSYPWNEEYGQYQLNQPSEQQWTHAAPCGYPVEHVVQPNQPQGHPLPRRSSREPPAMRHANVNPLAQPYQTVMPAMQHADVNPPAQAAQHYQAMAPVMHAGVSPQGQAYQTVLIVPQDQPIVFLPREQKPGVMVPMNGGGVMPFPVQPMPAPPVTHMPSAMPTQPDSAASDATSEPDQKAQKLNGKTKNRGYLKSDSAFNKMSTAQKEALCKYIYDFMVQKGFTNQEGYLIVDVFSEVWKNMGDDAEGWRVAQHRFGHLLRSAPQYFRLFRRGIRVANQCGWFARKGEKMVRLVLEKEK
jgi:hypothetical protein